MFRYPIKYCWSDHNLFNCILAYKIKQAWWAFSSIDYQWLQLADIWLLRHGYNINYIRSFEDCTDAARRSIFFFSYCQSQRGLEIGTLSRDLKCAVQMSGYFNA